jgi:hypothetical protein
MQRKVHTHPVRRKAGLQMRQPCLTYELETVSLFFEHMIRGDFPSLVQGNTWVKNSISNIGY